MSYNTKPNLTLIIVDKVKKFYDIDARTTLAETVSSVRRPSQLRPAESEGSCSGVEVRRRHNTQH